MNNWKKTLTVVVPSYNVEQYLPDVIPTYLDKRILEDIEILIVNDGSKDRTEEIASEYVAKYPDTVKLINKENGGHGSTINTGIQYAVGEYLKVIDGDDWVDTEYFICFVNELKKITVDVVLNSFMRVNLDNGNMEKRTIEGLEEAKQYSFKKVLPIIQDRYAMHGCTFKTSVLRKCREIDEHCFYVDQEFILYPAPYLESLVYFDLPVYQYRVGNVDQSMSLKNMQKNRNMHKKVIFSIIKMMDDLYNDLEIYKFLKYRIGKMCQLQIDIYFSMEKSRQARDELMEFMYSLKQKNKEIYETIPGKKAMMIRKVGVLAYAGIFAFKH